jgi:hypothetical protein
MSQEPSNDLNTWGLALQAVATPSATLPYGSSAVLELQEVITNRLEQLVPTRQIEIRPGFGWLVRSPPVTGVRIGALEDPPPGCPTQVQVAAGVVVDVPLSLALYREIALAGCHNYLGRFFIQEGVAPKQGLGLVAIRETLPGYVLQPTKPAAGLEEAFTTTFQQIRLLARASTDRFMDLCGGRPLTEDEEFAALLMA